jgi:transposase
MKKRQNSEPIIRDIKRKTRKRYNSEEKIRIVLEGLRGESTV